MAAAPTPTPDPVDQPIDSLANDPAFAVLSEQERADLAALDPAQIQYAMSLSHDTLNRLNNAVIDTAAKPLNDATDTLDKLDAAVADAALPVLTDAEVTANDVAAAADLGAATQAMLSGDVGGTAVIQSGEPDCQLPGEKIVLLPTYRNLWIGPEVTDFWIRQFLPQVRSGMAIIYGCCRLWEVPLSTMLAAYDPAAPSDFYNEDWMTPLWQDDPVVSTATMGLSLQTEEGSSDGWVLCEHHDVRFSKRNQALGFFFRGAADPTGRNAYGHPVDHVFWAGGSPCVPDTGDVLPPPPDDTPPPPPPYIPPPPPVIPAGPPCELADQPVPLFPQHCCDGLDEDEAAVWGCYENWSDRGLEAIKPSTPSIGGDLFGYLRSRFPASYGLESGMQVKGSK